ncbi:MAG TPA: molybdopterin-dependent oxidoreductase, partial [Gemmatimonadales bacterium]|nr:molybdopterin-dependent oxidoreductase [Gemmatimonadales bacterium]
MPQPRQRIIHDTAGLNTGEWAVIADDHFITPLERFFTRSHAPVPTVDPAAWRLEVGGLVERPRTFSLEELTGSFPEQTVAATLVCAGLRREEYLSVGPLPGELPWGPEPVSTGRWTGISLAGVLRATGISGSARQVEFVGLDQVERHGHRFGFGGSIDLGKAMSGEVLLATRLNGVPLPPAHGFPMRAIVPGWIGARNVKWLGRINLLDRPSDNYFQSRAYRVQREVNPDDPRDVSAGQAMSTVPLNAAIIDPSPDQVVQAGRLRVRGWAMGSGGSPLTGVEVSADAGWSWIPARISHAG